MPWSRNLNTCDWLTAVQCPCTALAGFHTTLEFDLPLLLRGVAATAQPVVGTNAELAKFPSHPQLSLTCIPVTGALCDAMQQAKEDSVRVAPGRTLRCALHVSELMFTK